MGKLKCGCTPTNWLFGLDIHTGFGVAEVTFGLGPFYLWWAYD